MPSFVRNSYDASHMIALAIRKAGSDGSAWTKRTCRLDTPGRAGLLRALCAREGRVFVWQEFRRLTLGNFIARASIAGAEEAKVFIWYTIDQKARAHAK
jgi:hypothetical protein